MNRRSSLILILVKAKLAFLLNGFERVNNISAGGAVLEPVSDIVVLMVTVFSITAVYLYSRENINKSKQWFLRSSLIISLLFFCLYLMDITELSVRVLPILYLFWPIQMLLLFENLKLDLAIVPLTLFVVIAFFVNLDYGRWSYDYYALITVPVKFWLDAV